MSGFLRVVGTLTFLGAVLGLIALIGQSRSADEVWQALPGVLSAMVGGVIVAAFGTMLEHMTVLRQEAEKQTKILEKLANPVLQKTVTNER